MARLGGADVQLVGVPPRIVLARHEGQLRQVGCLWALAVCHGRGGCGHEHLRHHQRSQTCTEAAVTTVAPAPANPQALALQSDASWQNVAACKARSDMHAFACALTCSCRHGYSSCKAKRMLLGSQGKLP